MADGSEDLLNRILQGLRFEANDSQIFSGEVTSHCEFRRLARSRFH